MNLVNLYQFRADKDVDPFKDGRMEEPEGVALVIDKVTKNYNWAENDPFDSINNEGNDNDNSDNSNNDKENSGKRNCIRNGNGANDFDDSEFNKTKSNPFDRVVCCNMID